MIRTVLLGCFLACVFAVDFNALDRRAEKVDANVHRTLMALKAGKGITGGKAFVTKERKYLKGHLKALKILIKAHKDSKAKGSKKVVAALKKFRKHLRRNIRNLKKGTWPGKKDKKRMKQTRKALRRALKAYKPGTKKRGATRSELKFGLDVVNQDIKLAKAAALDDEDFDELEGEDEIVCAGLCIAAVAAATSGTIIASANVGTAIHARARRGCLAADGLVMRPCGPLPISKLRLGDMVKTVNGFEKVYLIREESSLAEVLTAKTATTSFAMTPHHLVHTSRGRIAMKELKSGDQVYVDGTPTEVVSIESRTTKVRAPQTPSGTIVVNGVLVSTYTTSTATQIEWAVTFARPLFYVLPSSVQASLAELVYLLTKVH